MEFYENDLKIEKKTSSYTISKLETIEPDVFVELKDGKSLDIRDFQEDVIFVNFWATWCGPCIAEMPYFEEFILNFEGDDVKFLFVSDEEIDKIAGFKKEKGYSLPLYKVDSLHNIFFDHESIPTNYIIDKRNDIVFKLSGSANWNDELYVNLLRSVVN